MSETILDSILKTKRKEIRSLRDNISQAKLESRAAEAPPARDFISAVTREPRRALNLIAEIKKASPSKGLMREDFDPAALARQYDLAGADAISVLTDEQYFQGSIDYLRVVRESAGLPVLRKDFIIDPMQIYESRAAGADAILLIAAALPSDALRELHGLAGDLGMGVLLEVHCREEVDRVLEASLSDSTGWVMGINNRDLATFHVDLETTISLCSAIPAQRRVVSESGISSPEDVDRLAGAGVSAILVGETFMRSDDVAEAVSRLLGPLEG
jgi:indole-3-glycerol phosphate synthase